MSKPDVENLLKQAIAEIDNLNTGEVILLRDLFKGYEWKRYPISTRLHLGTSFLSYVEKPDSGLEKDEKTSSNQQKYKKK